MRLRLFSLCALAALTAGLPAPPAAAQMVPQGREFKVNPSDGVFHTTPTLAPLPSGEFMVVWGGLSDILGNPTGDVLGQRVSRQGVPVGGEFVVNTHTASSQGVPAIASNGAGAFVVVWESTYQDGDGHGVFGRSFNGPGLPMGAEFQANSQWTGLQRQASVAMNDAGDFAVAWASTEGDGEIFARLFQPDGSPRGAEFQVNTTQSGAQSAPDLAMNAAGDFVVVWQSDGGQDGDGLGIFGRLFGSAGGPVGGEFQVNQTTIGSQARPRVDMTPAGAFVVAWDGPVEDLSYVTIFGRTFDATGVPAGPELHTGFSPSFGGVQADVAAAVDGGFVLAWVGRDGWGRGVFARSFDSLGQPHRDAFQVNEVTSQDQIRPRISGDGNGRFMISWSSQLRPGIFARILGRPTLHVTQPLDGDPVDCSDPRLRRPTVSWEPAHYEEFRVEVGARTAFGTPMRDAVQSGWMRATSWTPPRGLWRKACRAGLAGGVYNAKVYLRVFGRDLDLPETDPAYLKVTDPLTLPIGIDLLNPPADPWDLEGGGRKRLSRPRHPGEN